MGRVLASDPSTPLDAKGSRATAVGLIEAGFTCVDEFAQFRCVKVEIEHGVYLLWIAFSVKPMRCFPFLGVEV